MKSLLKVQYYIVWTLVKNNFLSVSTDRKALTLTLNSNPKT
jgi:hypothetical protein